MPRSHAAELQLIEIAARDAQPWTACLTALGFHPGSRILGVPSPGQEWDRGNHWGRVFTSGTARILVTEAVGTSERPRNLAAEYFSRHGDGVARITLRVPDVPQAQRRATGAGAEAIPGQMRQADPDGNAMVESAFVGAAGVTCQLFAAPELRSGSPPTARGQMSIDYMVLAVERAELNAAARLYSQAFGMDLMYAKQLRAGDEQMRSMALGGGGWALIIVAQEPAAAPGVISAFLRTHGGPGIMHVAFRVPDIVTAVSQATARGAEFLPVPHEHYDSAPGNLGYEPPNLDALRRCRIAVGQDRDGGVTYQAATCPVSLGSRFNFGLVQRPVGTLELSSDTSAAMVAASAAAAVGRCVGEGS